MKWNKKPRGESSLVLMSINWYIVKKPFIEMNVSKYYSPWNVKNLPPPFRSIQIHQTTNKISNFSFNVFLFPTKNFKTKHPSSVNGDSQQTMQKQIIIGTQIFLALYMDIRKQIINMSFKRSSRFILSRNIKGITQF